MAETAQKVLNWTEQGYVPDTVIRHGIRRLLAQRLVDIGADDCERLAHDQQAFIAAMNQARIAEVPEKANEQHYEVPSAFFGAALGAQRKYSCCYWPEGVKTLDEAETAGLEQTCQHADLQDGQRVLELGCGWGSLTLWMAKHYPNSHITAVSNSHSQRAFIEQQAEQAGFTNVRVITCDMNDFETDHEFDRVVSVEMFEHMRNWEQLMRNIHRWLVPGGKLFMHIFVHARTPYLFQDKGSSDWMSRYFFSGGMMPSAALPLRCSGGLRLAQRWFWSGDHYARTCRAWLRNMDNQKASLRELFANTYGDDQAGLWWQRWRMFFMACEELFAYHSGREWFVAHYQFERPA